MLYLPRFKVSQNKENTPIGFYGTDLPVVVINGGYYTPDYLSMCHVLVLVNDNFMLS